MTVDRVSLLVLALVASPHARAPFADQPNALWNVVHGLCMTDKRITGLPAPCLAVDRARGFAVVPDPGSPTQVLLVPTRRLAGIESPALLESGSPNYWRYAWDARGYLERRARRSAPRDAVAMAINSVYGRTQNQLHIHIDCIRGDVREALNAYSSQLPRGWSAFPVSLAGHRYRAMRLEGETLGAHDPFKLLAAGDPEARADMRRQTLAVVGASLADGPGFVVLAATGGVPENPDGAAEDLLDHTCAVLR
jgi:CDP-diacylglycerol pyrophosphatase